MGTYRMKAEAALANEVARNFLAVTRSSLLSPEESIQNVKLGKEAALKAVSETCTIENTQEYGTLAPGRWQTDKVRRDSFASPFAFNLVFHTHKYVYW